jgi:dipeptidase D
VYAAPNGVMRMSDAVSGLVKTSTNLAIVKAEDDEIKIAFRIFSRKNQENLLVCNL